MTTATPATVRCPICRLPLDVRLAQGRKSGKPFIMMVCPGDGRHFRGFITDQHYVSGVTSRLQPPHAEEKAS